MAKKEQKPNYKEEQKKYREMRKSSVKMFWSSKEPGDIKGRTYVKPKDEKEGNK